MARKHPREYKLESLAPETGRFDLLNIFATPAGESVVALKGQPLPPQPPAFAALDNAQTFAPGKTADRWIERHKADTSARNSDYR